MQSRSTCKAGASYGHCLGRLLHGCFGNLSQLGARFGIHLTLEQWYRQYGPIYKFFLGRAPVVVVTDPDLLKQLCTKSFMKFHDRPDLQMRLSEGREISDEGMLAAKGRYWTGLRAACEPVFHSDKLQSYVPITNTALTSLIQKLDAVQADGPVEINLALAGMTMDVIGASAFGVNFKAQEDASSTIVQHALDVFRPPSGASFTLIRDILVTFPFLVPVMSFVMSFTRLPRVTQVVGARRFIKGASESLLRNARAEGKPNSSSLAAPVPDTVDSGVQCNSFAHKLTLWMQAPAHQIFTQAVKQGRQEYAQQVPRDQSLLHNLMAARRKDTGQPLSDLQICAQAFIFILAGYETTSMALTYTLYELARHPDIQQRVVQEVERFGREQEPQYADLAHFPLIDAVLKEGMRLHPPVTPLIALTCEATDDVMLGQYHIPAGTRIWINVRSLHLDDKHFTNAKDFVPDRFLEGEGQGWHHPYVYLPFGAGPRKCIGYRFAMMEGILALVRLYQRFTFSLNEGRHAGRPLEHESLITLMLCVQKLNFAGSCTPTGSHILAW
ncbi:hypothetical protein ABBQ32_001484 [Trebouxia sp. C0010 RCD-2024]